MKFIIDLLKLKKEKVIIEKINIENNFEIYFEDINFEVYVRNILKKKTGKIFCSEIYNIEGLNFFDWPLISIRGIENFKSLKYLILHKSKMNNISFLRELDNLEKIDLSWSDSISEIRSLQNLKNLKELILFYSPNISDYSSLSNNKNLEILDISENKINKIDFLSNLIELKNLNLSKNNLSSIKELEKLEKLEVLDLTYNKLEDIEVLSNLKNLKELNISVNNIKSIEPLKKLENIKLLDLRGNKIDFKDEKNKIVYKKLKLLKCKIKK